MKPVTGWSGISWALVIAGLLLGCGEDLPTTPAPNTVGPEGGVVTDAGGRVSVRIPVGAVRGPLTVTVAPATRFPANVRVVPGAVYELGPPDARFARPVELTIGYDAADVPPGIEAGELRLYTEQGDGWAVVPDVSRRYPVQRRAGLAAAAGREVSSGGDTAVAGLIDGFGLFGVLGVPVASVTVSAHKIDVVQGDTVRLGAVAKDAEGSVLGGRPIRWRSVDTTVASVDTEGLVTAARIGGATVVASAEGRGDTVAISVLPAVAAVQVAPDSVTVFVGDSLRFSATAKDVHGAVLTGRPVLWTSLDIGIARVDSAGGVRAGAPGWTTINATVQGRVGRAGVVVLEPVDGVSVTPKQSTLYVGNAVQLNATLRDGHGDLIAGRDVSWSSSDAAVAPVDDEGVVTAVGAGTTAITAASEGQNGSATVVVLEPVASVEVVPPATTLRVGDTVRLAATPKDGSGTALPGRQIDWLSSANLVASVDGSGLVTAAGKGEAAINAVSEGESGTAAITVLEPVASVDVSPVDPLLFVGETLALSATPRNATGGVLSDRDIEWRSSNSNVARVDQGGTVEGLAPGTAAVTAVIEGQSATVVVTVLEPVARVEVAPSTDTVFVGDQLQLTATARNASGAELSGRAIAWSSSNDAVGMVSADGVVTALTAGSVTITALVETESGASALTVLEPVASVSVSPASATVVNGGVRQLAATPLDASGASLPDRAVSWRSSDEYVATVDDTGLVTAHALGTVRIIATAEGVERTTPIHVPPPQLGTVADPTLLPFHLGREKDTVAFDSLNVLGMAAGDLYIDPVTGIAVYKVTDGNTPLAGNTGGAHDYAEGGPHISLPWGPAGEMRTLYLFSSLPGVSAVHYLVDFDTQTGEFANWRQAPSGNRELYWAFSNDPGTPQIAYYIGGANAHTITRYDTAVMAAANTGLFPKDLSVESDDRDVEWLQADKNDEWFVVQTRDRLKTIAWNGVSGVSWTATVSGNDEPHLDRDGTFVGIVADQGNSDNVLMLLDLADGTLTGPSAHYTSHQAPLRGHFVYAYVENLGDQRRLEPATGEIVQYYSSAQYFGGSGHRAGQWVVDNDPGERQWYVASHWGSGPPIPAKQAVVFVRADGSGVRLLAHHYSKPGSQYHMQPHATVSADGKVVMWKSNQNADFGAGRHDVFLALTPTR